jgi:hypothetical protein
MTHDYYQRRYGSGGEVRVRAHEREGGRVHVDPYTRSAPSC